MGQKYRFGKLEDALIELFRSGTPDFEAAEKILIQGASLNAQSYDDTDGSALSEILWAVG